MTSTFNKAFWFQFFPACVMGVLTIYLLVVDIIPLYYLWYTFIMWILVCGLGIAVGYHRIFSHRTHTLPVWKENIILFCAVFAGQGDSIFWVAMHRGYHHPHSDTLKDIHSPIVYGKWHSFVGWQYNITEANSPINFKYAIDLLRKPNHMWFYKHHHKLLFLVPCFVALWDWRLALAGFWLTTFLGVLQDNLVNVYGHVKNTISYRNFDTRDNSHNNLILGYTAWGQGWHNNHHANPGSYDFGRGVSGKWWEVDISLIFLPFVGPLKKK